MQILNSPWYCRSMPSLYRSAPPHWPAGVQICTQCLVWSTYSSGTLCTPRAATSANLFRSKGYSYSPWQPYLLSQFFQLKSPLSADHAHKSQKTTFRPKNYTYLSSSGVIVHPYPLLHVWNRGRKNALVRKLRKKRNCDFRVLCPVFPARVSKCVCEDGEEEASKRVGGKRSEVFRNRRS